MGDWKKGFDKSTLERGKNYCAKNRVDGLKETEGIWTGAVLGRERYEVSVRGYGSDALRTSCQCPVARSGRCCEHMAAVLYAIDAGKNSRQEKSESFEADLMAQWVKYDEELCQAEREREAGAASAAEETEKAKAAQAKPRRKRRTKQEMEAARREAAEAAKQEEELRRQAEAAKEKRQAREARKAERKKREAEQKAAAEEARLKQMQKAAAEEARREEIRRKKEEEAERRAKKREKEQEEAKRLAEQREKERKKEEQEKRAAERARQQKEAGILEEQRIRQREYELLGTPLDKEAEETGGADVEEQLEALDRYTYFDGKAVRESVKITPARLKEASDLLAKKAVVMEEISTGFSRSTGEIGGQVTVVGKSGKNEFRIGIGFSRNAVLGIDCGCPKCRKSMYYSWNPSKADCAFTTAALLLLEEYLASHNIGDATDRYGSVLLAMYRSRRENLLLSDAASVKEGSLVLTPRLIKKDDRLTVSFKVGEKKLFVVKNLTAFCENVKNSATDTYGSSTQINHNPDHFTERGRGWIRFISRIVREEEEFLERLAESRYYYNGKTNVGGELNLFGWRLDEFYDQLGTDAVEYEDRSGREKEKDMLVAARRNPKVEIRIAEERPDGQKKQEEFHGIRVKGSLPELFQGTDTAYYIEKGNFCRVEKEFLARAEALAKLTDGNLFSFSVGRNHLAEFYYRILPELREIAVVDEQDTERIHACLLPEVRFTFYLDAEEGNASCQMFSCYGEREYQVFDVLREEEDLAADPVEPFRDTSREEEVLFLVMKWFPAVDPALGILHCGGDENNMFRLMESGVRALTELGEVRCTKRFLGYQAVKQVRVSVGVSVSSGLLELEIATEDVPQAELLEMLSVYRTKKKYYRLKDGSFVSLSDPSLEMLSELADAAHLKPKELIRGKMQLPMYRTLYLDKLLEEHESVYSSRDAHFREIVKGFKTVKDADFEEPESLSRIMRNYQKNGYKWLRTIESWQFGGILADDMGLGKTLQVIAVLLAAKEEGQKGTSLVVSPASLVYNWEGEFARFAPGLSVMLITGNQEERQKKIAQCGAADVVVTSYDLLKRDIALYEDQEFLYEVIDEAQYIKNHTTAAAKAVKVIRSRTRYALTGTPIENRLSELWSIFDYLMPGFLYGYDVFRKEIETPIVKNGDEAAMQRLQKMACPFILRRLKSDVLRDLPEKMEEDYYVRLGEEQQKLYDGQVLHMRESLARQDDAEFQKNKMRILAELTRLRQICCDPSLCFEDYKKGSAKLETCVELIKSAADGGHRILLFSQFTSMLELIHDRLNEEQISCYTITGGTKKEERLTLVKAFNEGDIPVFLISLKAGGVGLNLTGADIVIHYDPWWNVAAQNQATDRAHRIGQIRQVTVYKLIAKGTVEEKIKQLQETKRDLAEQVISGNMSGETKMSREELLELLEV